MKKFAIILSGSGVYDGAEIHEATMTMYSIVKQGAEYEIFAPNIDQHHVINHITGEEMPQKRNVLIESARIARGNIKSLNNFNSKNFDYLIMPGGFGVAKNLSSFAFDGVDCSINPEVEKVIKDMHSEGKAIGALCISPVVVAKVLGGVEVTIGKDEETAEAIGKMGAKHSKTEQTEVMIDEKNKIFTTPCYMLDAKITDIAKGASNIVEAMLKY